MERFDIEFIAAVETRQCTHKDNDVRSRHQATAERHNEPANPR